MHEQLMLTACLGAREQPVRKHQALARAAGATAAAGLGLKVPKARVGVQRAKLRQLCKVRRKQRGHTQLDEVLRDGPCDGHAICGTPHM